MSKLTDKASYLKGLAEGMSLNPEKASHRLLSELISLANEMAQEMEGLSNQQEELNDFVEAIDSDLAQVEEILFDDGTVEDAEGEEEADASDSDVEISYTCPGCGKELQFNVADINFETFRCPDCDTLVFPEVGEDEEDEEDLSLSEDNE